MLMPSTSMGVGATDHQVLDLALRLRERGNCANRIFGAAGTHGGGGW